MSKSSKKVKKAKLTGHGRSTERSHWKILDPVDRANGNGLSRANFDARPLLIKNHGPEPVWLVAEQGDRMDLSAGTVHATYAAGTITVENESEKWVSDRVRFFAHLSKVGGWPAAHELARSNKAWRGAQKSSPVSILKPAIRRRLGVPRASSTATGRRSVLPGNPASVPGHRRARLADRRR